MSQMGATPAKVSDLARADLVLVTRLALFGVPFAVNSSLHSYLILAYAGSKKAAEDVGFYFAANVLGPPASHHSVRLALSTSRPRH